MRVDVTGLDVQLGARPIVSDVHLSLAFGTVYGLLGPNGCGKSTLLRAVAGITPPPPGGGSITTARTSPRSPARMWHAAWR